MNAKFIWAEKVDGFIILKTQRNEVEHYHSKWQMKYGGVDVGIIDVINYYIDNGYTFLGVLNKAIDFSD